MPYVVICKREKRPELHVFKPNTMAIHGQPYLFDDIDVARAEAASWATLYKAIHPDYKVVVRKVEAPARKRVILRR